MTISAPLPPGTGNIFADDFLTANMAQSFKAELARHITRKIDESNMTISEAAKLCDSPQADIKRIRKGDIGRFSVEEMTWVAKQFHLSVKISVSVPQSKAVKTKTERKFN